MSQPPRPSASVADLVVLAAVLERDEQRPRSELIERGRRIGAAHPQLPEDRGTLALWWLEAAVADDSALAALRHRVAGTLHAGGIVLAVVGLVAGWLAALGAFYYDGSGRINVIAVLAVLVGVPLLLLLAFLVAALPRRALAWLPGATAWSALARGLSPGRLGALALRLAPSSVREALERFRARAGEHQVLYARVQKWQLLRWSQTFAVAFEVAALTAMLALVSFTDLVFGWSTTLASGDPAADAAYVHRIATTMAWPWSWAVEEAVPSVELIRESRYYRVVNETISPEEASRLGGWWPFVALSMLLYGLAPRAVLLAVAEWRLRRAVRGALASTPGLSAVVQRIHAGQVQTTTGGETAEARSDFAGTTSNRGTCVSRKGTRTGFRAVVNWSGVPVSEAAVRAQFGDAPLLAAGGASSIAADQAVVNELARESSSEAADIAVIVKAWEPPLLEFTDFVQAIRRGLGPGPEIVVFPVSAGEADAFSAGDPAPMEMWRRQLGRVGDPWLRVAEVGSEDRE